MNKFSEEIFFLKELLHQQNINIVVRRNKEFKNYYFFNVSNARIISRDKIQKLKVIMVKIKDKKLKIMCE